MNNPHLVLFCLVFPFYLVSCGDSPTPHEPVVKDITVSTTDTADTAIKDFLYSIPGSYGWSSANDDNSYDFMQNGNLFIQGKDGEATMWEGNWSLEGEQINMKCADILLDKTLPIKKMGDSLMIGDKIYQRYTPSEE